MRSTSDDRLAQAQVCLLHALRALGFPVPHVGPGPFWALKDGNVFLRPFNKHLRPHLDQQLESGHDLTLPSRDPRLREKLMHQPRFSSVRNPLGRWLVRGGGMRTL